MSTSIKALTALALVLGILTAAGCVKRTVTRDGSVRESGYVMMGTPKGDD